MLVSYPALFYYDFNDDDTDPYFITFPDFQNSATQGSDVSDAMAMATDYLGITIADYIENNCTLPKPSNLNEIDLEKNDPFKNDPEINSNFDREKSFKSIVLVDISKYLNQDDPVKKTLTIPRWADEVGKKLNLNFSKTLTEAILEKKLNA